MKKKNFILILIVVSVFAFNACQKVIDVKLDEGKSQLAVSAFVSNKPGVQTIILSKTAPYFYNATCPAATGATVAIADNKGNHFNFVDYTNSGRYEWSPSSGDTLVHTGYSYTLSIAYGGEQYQAASIANPVPKIDSMNYKFMKGQGGPNSKEADYAAFYARDIKGRPDYYWIKTFKNDSLLSPQSVNLSIDGAIGGPGGDGLPFIYPVRFSINPENGYAPGDTCSIDLYSINSETYYFFLQVLTQTQNAGLFAEPPANVPTNIKNVNANSTVKAVGFFNMAMLSTKGIKIK